MPEEQPPLLLPALSKRQRWAAAVVGVALLGAGGVAVFQAENDWSTVALLVGGVVFAMMALTGYGLTRVRVGQAEVEFQAIQYARQLIGVGDEERATEVLLAAARPRPVGTEPQPLLPRSSPADYESQVLDTIDSLLSPPARLVRHPPDGMARLDGLIEIDRRALGVDVRAGSRFNPGYVLARIHSMFADPTASLDALLIVIHARSDDTATQRLREAVRDDRNLPKPVTIITWMPQDPATVLNDAIESWIHNIDRGAK